MSLSKAFGKDNSLIFNLQDKFKKSFAKFEPSYVFCDNNVNVGIEVEVERIHTSKSVFESDDKSCFLWSNTEDGSLRNNGREFVSIPVKGQNIEFALTTLNEFLTKNRYTKDHEFSDRTSVHIHVDCSDMTEKNIQSLVATYIAVEPLLYAFVGGDRNVNIFSVPVNETTIYDDYLNHLFTEKVTYGSIDGVSRAWHKYTGLNLVPLRSYCTAEFRHMVGTCDVLRLCDWINALLQIRKYAITHDPEYIFKRLVNMNTVSDYGSFINDVFIEDDVIVRKTNVDLVSTLEQTTGLFKSIQIPRKISGKVIKFDDTAFSKLGIVGVKNAPRFDDNLDAFIRQQQEMQGTPAAVEWVINNEQGPLRDIIPVPPVNPLVEGEEVPENLVNFNNIIAVNLIDM